MIIDTHCHLYNPKLVADIEGVLNRSAHAGVSRILMPNVDKDTIGPMLELEQKYEGMCYAMMGLHPCDVKEDYREQLAIVEKYLKERDFIAVGEIGIDLYWDKTYYKEQLEALARQVEWAELYGIPVALHCRSAHREMMDALKTYGQVRGVYHCFSGNLAEAEEAVAAGLMLGIGGVATFKNGGLDKVIPHVDIKHLLLETDAPYLAPEPHRGKTNEPAFVSLVCERVASLKGMSYDEVAAATTANAVRLFDLD